MSRARTPVLWLLVITPSGGSSLAISSSSVGGIHCRDDQPMGRLTEVPGIGGTIGTALYVQIGHGLLDGGPGSLFLAFTIW